MCGSTDIGQGSDSILAYIVAEVLGIDPFDIRVVTADTDLTPVDLGSYSSRVTLMTGNAAIQSLVAMLVQADRFGTSIAQSLRGHADFMRVQARQIAEEKAAKLGVKLVFPIFFCILPSLFVVTVGPVAMRIIRELVPTMQNI